MARLLGFELGHDPALHPDDLKIVVEPSSVPAALLRAHVDEMSRRIPANVLRPACIFFSGGGVTGVATSGVEAETNAFRLRLPPEATAEPWRVACLLNLIDFAVAEEDADLKLVHKVDLPAILQASAGSQDLFAALELRKAQARHALRSLLPADFAPDKYVQGEWPEEAEYYVFRIVCRWPHSILPEAQAQLVAYTDALDKMIGWMAFEVSGNAADWQEQAKMLYAFDTESGDREFSITLDGPPSDIAIAVEWLLAFAQTVADALESVTVEIEPR